MSLIGATQPLLSRDCKGAVLQRPGVSHRRVCIQLPVTPLFHAACHARRSS
jgi:hypothetical protein